MFGGGLFKLALSFTEPFFCSKATTAGLKMSLGFLSKNFSVRPETTDNRLQR